METCEKFEMNLVCKIPKSTPQIITNDFHYLYDF